MRSDDWTPQQILSALKKKGINLNQLILENNIDIQNFNALERCIASALNIPLQILWPSRYHQNE